MKVEIRTKTLLWLIVVLAPMFVAVVVVSDHVENRLSEQTQEQLSNARRLESARISSVLDDYAADLATLAAGLHVRDFTSQVLDARAGEHSGTIGGYDGFRLIDATDEMPLGQVADSVLERASVIGAEVVDLTIVGRDGTTLGATDDASWTPLDEDLVTRTIATASIQFGDAFESGDGSARLGLVTPIMGPDDSVVGAIVAETRLSPIADLVLEHEKFGETIEAHIAQRLPNGDAQFITLLRFERDAAFSKVVPAETGLPIVQSLNLSEGTVIRSPDYRAVDSYLAIETLDRVGWGLVVKIDADEALAPAREIRGIIVLAAALVGATVLFGWMFFLRPLSRRLSSTARAARRVAGGSYLEPIDDTSTDEIGELARSIDQLAQDLDADIRMRAGAERKLVEQATRDQLTGLYNRAYAQAHVGTLCESEDAQEFSLLFLDLDGFKTVNDSFGHQIGDEILIEVANRLDAFSNESTVVARWGGDEFVVVANGVDVEQAEEMTTRVDSMFAGPLQSSVGRHAIQCSVGTSTFTAAESLQADDVLHDADVKMFHQKQSSKGVSVVSSRTLRRVERALDEGRFEVWYQPLVDIDEFGLSRWVGVESLVRLRDVDGAMVSPDEFMPAIHDNHLGLALDRYVLRRTLDDLRSWQLDGAVAGGFGASVNLTGAAGRSSEFPNDVHQELTRTGIEAGHLVVEISEQTAIVDTAVIDDLRALGVKIAVDDLGVQNSNMDRLDDLVPDVIKIDRRWTDRPESPVNAGMMSSIVLLAKQIGSVCIAEGVETDEQLQALRALGLTSFQGYLLGRPQPAAAFLSSLAVTQSLVK